MNKLGSGRTVSVSSVSSLSDKKISIKEKGLCLYLLKEPSLLPLRRLVVVILYFAGSIAFYSKHEGWSFFECLFFIISTISTVGYGSPSPTDDMSRLFSIFFIFVGICVIFSGISDLANHRLNKVQEYFCGACFKASEKKDEETLHHKKTMVLAMFYILFINLMGAIAFKYIEGWSWITAFYFAVETSTSVGFGELPISEATRVFLCFYIIISIVLIAYAVNSFNAVLVAQNTLRERKLLLRQMQSLDFIADLNDGQGVRKHEFVLAVLSHLGVLDKERDVDPWMKKFEDFDTDDSGILNREEMSFFFEQETAESREELRRIKERAKASVIKEMLDDRMSFVENMLPSFAGAAQPFGASLGTAGSETSPGAVPTGVGAGYGPGRGSLFMGGMPSMHFGSRRGTGGTIQADKVLAQNNKADDTFSGWNTTPNPITSHVSPKPHIPVSAATRSGSTTAAVEPQENPMHSSSNSNINSSNSNSSNSNINSSNSNSSNSNIKSSNSNSSNSNSNSSSSTSSNSNSPKSGRAKKSPISKPAGPIKINKALAKTRAVRAPSDDLEMGSMDASDASSEG